MVLDYKNGQFVFRCTYEEREIPKAARFWFNPTLKQWVTSSAKCAVRLRQYATQTARARFVDMLVGGFRFRDANTEKPARTGRFMKVKRR